MPAVQSSRPVRADFPSERLTIGAGAAIFHLASSRVVLCYHTRDKYWFLPKGRRNANEETRRAAEREAFEESGFRNRLLPLPMRHRQPDGDEGHAEYVTEPVWTQLLELSSRSQYLLHWYIAETVPSTLDNNGEDGTVFEVERRHYRPPEPFPDAMTLKQRVEQDSLPFTNGKRVHYEPKRHEGTGVDEEEALYWAELMPVEEAMRKLGGSVMEDVVRRGWDSIQLRMSMEE